MKKEEWNEGLNNLDADLIEEYVDEKDKLRQKKAKSMHLRIGAVAACFAIAVSAVFTLPLLKKDEEPYLPNIDTAVTEEGTDVGSSEPVTDPDPNNESFALSSAELDKLFADLAGRGPTNQYQEIYAASPEHLLITPLKYTEYLPLYSFEESAPSKEDFKSFIDEHIDIAAEAFGISSRSYEIEEDEFYKGGIMYSTELYGASGELYFDARENEFRFGYHCYGLKRLEINGSLVFISESDTDEQIRENLNETFDYVADSLGFEYTDVFIARHYSEEELEYVRIYLYSPDGEAASASFAGYPIDREPAASEYVSLQFQSGDVPGRTYLRHVGFNKIAGDKSDYLSVDKEAKMISLEEAEELLEKGYVFGGHSCRLCMAAQPEVDFSEYDYAELEYVSGITVKKSLPFYAFYKYIGETKKGIGTYAKTYVPAVEVGGLDEYFEMQTKRHK